MEKVHKDEREGSRLGRQQWQPRFDGDDGLRKWFRQQHPMRSGIPTNTRRSLRRRSPVKWKHLGMMGTPVWCLPWALRCLSVLSGPGCSGRPGRVGCLGYRVDSEQQDAMGVTGKGATVPVRAGDRRVVVSDGTGARLALLPGYRCSEHHTVRARACSDENGGGGRPKDLFSENVRL
ncbi:hypothetical protein TIFTF001_030512 [Ficus carica]|uniref:Uncharacterized protein n=1 Tax=Ficus carica TaxID=3494 RepID=A0AA88J2Y8_FICCA|nr:hypothetical protein TIFTF001_030512 [Ficus carica]